MALSASSIAFPVSAADCEDMAAEGEEPKPLNTKLSPVGGWTRLVGTGCLN
jgi:hypothetical protein